MSRSEVNFADDVETPHPGPNLCWLLHTSSEEGTHEKVYVDFTVPDSDLFDQGFHDFPRVFRRQSGPLLIHGVRLVHYVVSR